MNEIDISMCKYYNPNEEGYNIDTGKFKKGACEIKVAIGDYGEFSHYGLCNNSSDCYYKQLQQLKIENEKLRFPREDINFAVLTKEEFENYERLKELEKSIVNETKFGFYNTEHGKECHRLILKNEELEEQLQQLKVENEKFKKFVAHNLFNINCDNWLDRFIDYFEKWKHELVAENEELKKATITLVEGLNTRQNILDEIEGIVKNTCRKRCTNDCLGTKKYCGYGKILQKIKEVKGG